MNMNKLAENLQKVDDHTVAHKIEMEQNLDNCRSLVLKLSNSDYKVVVQTGTTPVRTNYEFPREITAVNSPNTLIQDFRKRPSLYETCLTEQLAGAMAVPLGTSDVNLQSSNVNATPKKVRREQNCSNCVFTCRSYL